MTPHRSSSSSKDRPFEVGQTVIYGVHGKCLIKEIVSRTLDDTTVKFYKLEMVKNTASKKQESFIFVPVKTAIDNGMRVPADENQSNAIFSILQNPAYFFKMSRNWQQTFQQLKTSIESEGAVGLAKSINFLHAMRKKQNTLSSEISKFEAQVLKQLVRELSDSLGETPVKIEERITKIFKGKQLHLESED